MIRPALWLVAAAAIAALSSVVSPVRAQDAGLRAEVVSVADDTFPFARAIINVEGASGELAALTSEQVSVTLNGARAAVASAELASSEDAPLDVVIAMDTSGSMEGAPLASAKDAAKAFINDLGPADRVAVLNFGDQVTLAADFTADRAVTAGAIDSLVAVGNTALYQATTVASVKAGSSPAARRAIVLLSDGADFGGKSIATREESIFAATSAGVPVFTIAQGSDLDRDYLQQIASVTKGRYLEAPNPEDLRGLYTAIGRLLRSQYIIRFDASFVAALPEASVTITLRAGESTAESTATYRPSPGFLPAVQISGILPGEQVTAPRDVTATIAGGAAGTVTWFVDNNPVATIDAAPYAFNYDPASYGSGAHVLRASASVGGATLASPDLSFDSLPPAAPGGGLPLIPMAGAAVVLLAIGGGVLLFLRRNAHDGGPGIPVDQRTVPWAAQLAQRRPVEPAPEPQELPVAVEEVGEPLGVIISRGGADVGAEYTIGATPVSVGSGRACAVRIDDAELGSVEARAWVRGGHLMLHRMTRLTAIAADGTTGGWTILEQGDTFEIGRHTYEFRMIEAAPAPAAAEDGVLNVLRDTDTAAHADGEPPPPRLTDMMPREARIKESNDSSGSTPIS